MALGRTSNASTAVNDNKGSHGTMATNGRVPGSHAASEPFRLALWLRLHGVDLITMALMGALGLGVYFACERPQFAQQHSILNGEFSAPAPSRSFPIFFQDGEVVYPQFAYPLRREIVPIWAAALIAFLTPFFFFCLFQARRRSMDDLLTTTMGLLKSELTRSQPRLFSQE